MILPVSQLKLSYREVEATITVAVVTHMHYYVSINRQIPRKKTVHIDTKGLFVNMPLKSSAQTPSVLFWSPH